MRAHTSAERHAEQGSPAAGRPGRVRGRPARSGSRAGSRTASRSDIDRLTHRRQQFGEQSVPDEQLQQQRHVAHHLDVAEASRDQPVARQARDADHACPAPLRTARPAPATISVLTMPTMKARRRSRTRRRRCASRRSRIRLPWRGSRTRCWIWRDARLSSVLRHQVPADAHDERQQQDLVDDASLSFAAEHAGLQAISGSAARTSDHRPSTARSGHAPGPAERCCARTSRRSCRPP
jgi:hypothetical protein